MRQDYLLSNRYRQEEVQKRLGQLRSLAAGKQGIAPEAVDMGNMEAFLIQDGSYIDATRDEVTVAYGSFANYITKSNILPEKLQETLLS